MLACVEAILDGHVVMVVVEGEALDTHEKIVVSGSKVADSVMADGCPDVGSVVLGSVAMQGSLQVGEEWLGICMAKALFSSSARPRKVVRHQLLVFHALNLRLLSLSSLRSRKACRDDGKHQDQGECSSNEPRFLVKDMVAVLLWDLLKSARCIGHVFVEEVVEAEVSVVLSWPTIFDRDILGRHIALQSYRRSLMTDRGQDSNKV